MNPASVKQVLMDSADQIVGANMFEQGRGSVNLVNAYQVNEFMFITETDILQKNVYQLPWKICFQVLLLIKVLSSNKIFFT